MVLWDYEVFGHAKVLAFRQPKVVLLNYGHSGTSDAFSPLPCTITERAFNKVHLQAQFLTESLSSFYGIFFVVFMMLGRIFSKIICHSVLQSVAFVSVKTHV